MKIARIRLVPEQAHRIALAATFEDYARIEGVLAALPVRNRNSVVELNQVGYQAVKAKLASTMPSRLIQNAIREFAAGEFSPTRLPVDDRLFSFKDIDRVSLATVSGRIQVPCHVLEYSDLDERGVLSHLECLDDQYTLFVTLSESLQKKEFVAMQSDTLASRVTRLAVGLASKILDTVEAGAPNAAAKGVICEFDRAADEARRSLSAAIAERERLKSTRRDLASDQERLENNVVTALRAGEDHLAEVGAERLDDLQTQMEAVDRLIAEQDSHIEDFKTALRAAESARRVVADGGTKAAKERDRPTTELDDLEEFARKRRVEHHLERLRGQIEKER